MKDVCKNCQNCRNEEKSHNSDDLELINPDYKTPTLKLILDPSFGVTDFVMCFPKSWDIPNHEISFNEIGLVNASADDYKIINDKDFPEVWIKFYATAEEVEE